MAYNLWADKHLKTNLFQAGLYGEQTAWYPTVERAYMHSLVRTIAADLCIYRGIRSSSGHAPSDNLDQVGLADLHRRDCQRHECPEPHRRSRLQVR
jgi:hypothetical protein